MSAAHLFLQCSHRRPRNLPYAQRSFWSLPGPWPAFCFPSVRNLSKKDEWKKGSETWDLWWDTVSFANIWGRFPNKKRSAKKRGWGSVSTGRQAKGTSLQAFGFCFRKVELSQSINSILGGSRRNSPDLGDQQQNGNEAMNGRWRMPAQE